MTPKEKAREIVGKYADMKDNFNTYAYDKQCALIAVDELINETQFEVPNIRQKYWIEVKQEIKNL